MKSTRILAMLFAIILVLFGYNIPAISSGGDEAHPWDQEGTGTNGGHADTTIVINGGTSTPEPFVKSLTSNTVQLAMTIQYIVWYRDLPNVKTAYGGKGVVSRNSKSVKLYLDAR
jgi:hypothetical protein